MGGREINEGMMEKAVEMALKDAREKAPGATLVESLQMIRLSRICNMLLVLYQKRSLYQKVVAITRPVLTRMLAASAESATTASPSKLRPGEGGLPTEQTASGGAAPSSPVQWVLLPNKRKYSHDQTRIMMTGTPQGPLHHALGCNHHFRTRYSDHFVTFTT